MKILLPVLIALLGLRAWADEPAGGGGGRAGSEPRGNGTVSLKVQGEPLQVVLQRIAREAGVALALHQGSVAVDKPVSATLRAVPVDMAFDQVLRGYANYSVLLSKTNGRLAQVDVFFFGTSPNTGTVAWREVPAGGAHNTATLLLPGGTTAPTVSAGGAIETPLPLPASTPVPPLPPKNLPAGTPSAPRPAGQPAIPASVLPRPSAPP